MSSTAFKGYKRLKLPDGSFQPEYYSFGNGGKWSGTLSDETIDNLGFMDIARIVEDPLAKQNYLPAKDPKNTGLVIMLYWGTTQVAEPIRDSAAYIEYADIRSQISGEPLPSLPNKYVPTVSTTGSLIGAMNSPPNGTDSEMAELGADSVTMLNMEERAADPHRASRTPRCWATTTLTVWVRWSPPTVENRWGAPRSAQRGQPASGAEVESPRYFVVLMAYDFRLMWKEKKHKLLWETRFSINQPHNDFTKALPAMANFAGSYFGRNSHGLIREKLRVGNVEVGEPTLVELLGSSKK